MNLRAFPMIGSNEYQTNLEKEKNYKIKRKSDDMFNKSF